MRLRHEVELTPEVREHLAAMHRIAGWNVGQVRAAGLDIGLGLITVALAIAFAAWVLAPREQ